MSKDADGKTSVEPRRPDEQGTKAAVVDRHTNNFDVIRFVLAASVILSHSPTLIDGSLAREPLARITPDAIEIGAVAVNCFFLISGFLIVQSWLFTRNTLLYLQKRILRIYPGFIAASLFSILVAGAIGSAPRPEKEISLSVLAASAKAYYRAMDIHYLHHELKQLATLQTPVSPPTPTFSDSHYPTLNGAIWTVRYEFCCYLLLLGMGLAGILKRRTVVALLTAVAYITYILQSFGFLHVSNYEAPIIGLINQWPRFTTYYLLGVCFYLYRDKFRPDWKLAVGSLLLLILGCAFRGFSAVVLPVFGGYLLFYLAFVETKSLRRFGKRGDFSYGLFCYGWPIQKLILWRYPNIGPALLFIESFSLALICAVCSWYLIERPFLRLKSRKSAPETVGAPPPSVSW